MVWAHNSEFSIFNGMRSIIKYFAVLGSLSKDDGNGNDDARKQWSDWLNDEVLHVLHAPKNNSLT